MVVLTLLTHFSCVLKNYHDENNPSLPQIWQSWQCCTILASKACQKFLTVKKVSFGDVRSPTVWNVQNCTTLPTELILPKTWLLKLKCLWGVATLPVSLVWSMKGSCCSSGKNILTIKKVVHVHKFKTNAESIEKNLTHIIKCSDYTQSWQMLAFLYSF